MLEELERSISDFSKSVDDSVAFRQHADKYMEQLFCCSVNEKSSPEIALQSSEEPSQTLPTVQDSTKLPEES